MYSTINHSTKYYQLKGGYKYIHTPWTVREEISNITKPEDRRNFIVKGSALVASGEQSFMQLMYDGEIEPGKYCTVTPCFRDEDNETEFHKTYFMKTELIYWEKYDPVSVEQNERFDRVRCDMIDICKSFYSLYLPVEEETLDINLTTTNHYNLSDIISVEGRYELGSYGIRIHNGFIWVYGTGCAEPRLSNVISKYYPKGYHNLPIPKTKELGTEFKIMEEYEEFIDALLSNNPIMAQVELADLYGSIEFYIKKRFNLSMEDLKNMSDITKQAFENGRRH
jgi:hypothetical protein